MHFSFSLSYEFLKIYTKIWRRVAIQRQIDFLPPDWLIFNKRHQLAFTSLLFLLNQSKTATWNKIILFLFMSQTARANPRKAKNVGFRKPKRSTVAKNRFQTSELTQSSQNKQRTQNIVFGCNEGVKSVPEAANLLCLQQNCILFWQTSPLQCF